MEFQAIAKLGGKVESEVSVRTTHVVSPNGERTMNILRGVIRACEIVNVGWLHDSLAQEKWLETTTYQHDICDSNRVSCGRGSSGFVVIEEFSSAGVRALDSRDEELPQLDVRRARSVLPPQGRHRQRQQGRLLVRSHHAVLRRHHRQAIGGRRDRQRSSARYLSHRGPADVHFRLRHGREVPGTDSLRPEGKERLRKFVLKIFFLYSKMIFINI